MCRRGRHVPVFCVHGPGRPVPAVAAICVKEGGGGSWARNCWCRELLVQGSAAAGISRSRVQLVQGSAGAGISWSSSVLSLIF